MPLDDHLPDPEAHRPWGFYEILSSMPDHKVKRITRPNELIVWNVLKRPTTVRSNAS